MKLTEYAVREESININPFDDLVLRESKYSPNKLVYSNPEHNVWLYQANCLEFMDKLIKKYPNGKFDMIFADPPYFLSNGGISCHAGKMVKVDKGEWDKSKGAEVNHEFNREWIKRCQALLNPNGTLWVSGTQHVIYSVGYAMQQLDMKILNDIIWENPIHRLIYPAVILPIQQKHFYGRQKIINQNICLIMLICTKKMVENK